jgi:hypothetical protein
MLKRLCSRLATDDPSRTLLPLRSRESSGVFREVRIEEIPNDADWKTGNASNNEEPLPAGVPKLAIEIPIRCCLKISAEHAG